MLNDSLKAKIDVYCYLIERGKPCAMLPIQNRYFNEAIKIVKKNNLKCFGQYLADDWTTFWIYKDSLMLQVIINLPHEPKTVYDHWVLGKVFGYSDRAIWEYIKKEYNK